MKTTFEIINFYWGTLNLVDSKININAALILPNDPFLILTSKDNTVYFSNTTHLFNSLFWLYRAFNILPSVHCLLLIPCRLGCWFAVSLICLFLKKKKIFLFTLNSRVNNFIWLDIDLFSYNFLWRRHQLETQVENYLVQNRPPRAFVIFPGRYFRNFWVGTCRWDHGTLNLYQS